MLLSEHSLALKVMIRKLFLDLPTKLCHLLSLDSFNFQLEFSSLPSLFFSGLFLCLRVYFVLVLLQSQHLSFELLFSLAVDSADFSDLLIVHLLYQSYPVFILYLLMLDP